MEHAQTQATESTPLKFEAEESKYRLLQENFISPAECQMLVELVETYGEVGDGYQGNPHPHTPTEIFGGYSFEGFRHSKPRMVPGHREALRIMLRARKLIKKHFGLPFLWLDYGHLVFREPIPEAVGSTEEEFSHPWHFDNQSEGVKHRTHTAILYLNEEFTGGLTRFRETDYMPFRELQPEPGKLVAFDVGANAHGVSKLTSGRRYVLNMWFSTHWRMLAHHYRIFRAL